jgi:beta-lactamase class A
MRFRRWFALLLLLPTMAWAGTLQQDLDAMARSFHGRIAIYAKDLNTGRSVAVAADEEVATASVIKLPVMLEAMYQVKAGRLKLDDPIVLKDSDKVQGSGVLQFLHGGLRLTLEDAISLMMMLSDNTGANLVMEAAGIPNVNARLAAMGLKHTCLYKEVYKKPAGPMPPDQKKFGLGKTTAREMAAVMESVARCDLGDKALCDKMIYIMKNQQYRNMVARDLETVDTTETPSTIAAKLGQLDDVRNEVALVETPGAKIVISAFTWDNQDQRWTPDNEAEVLIGRMARRIVDEWGRPPAAPK